jgi:hypothetical protein
MADPWAGFKVIDPGTGADPWAKFKTVDMSTVEKAAAVPAEEEASIWERLGSGAMGIGEQAVRGAAAGVTNILGLPQASSQMTRSALQFGANKLGAPDWVDPAIEALTPFATALPSAEEMQQVIGVDNIEPQTGPERFARRIGEELGAFAVPTGAALGIAGKLGVEGARKLPGLARMFIEPAAVNAPRYLAREGAVATAAGAGAATANEMVDPETTKGQIADVLGAIAGATGYGLAANTAKKAGEIGLAITGSKTYSDDVVRQVVTDTLAENAGLTPATPRDAIDVQPLIEAIERGPRVSGIVPGFQESLADRTGNPGLAALEYGLQSRGGFTQRNKENIEAVDAALRQLEPEGQPGALRTALSDERDMRIGEANRRVREAEDAAREATEVIRPQGTPAARGEIVRTALEDAREAAQLRTEEAYGAADIDGIPIDPVQVRDMLQNVEEGLTAIERGLVPQGIIDRVAALGRRAEEAPVETGVVDMSGRPITRPPAPLEPVPLKEVTDLQSELKRFRRAALADPKAERGGRNAARVAQRYLQAVDNFVNSQLTPEQIEAVETARGAKLEEAEAFTRAGDPVSAALARYEGGQPRMRDERVASAFVNPQAMDRLFAQADTPQVRAAIEDELLAQADTSTVEGVQRFMADHAEQISRFPGLQDELDAALRARGAERVARENERGVVSQIGEKGKGTVAEYLRYGNENARKAMESVLAAKDPARAADELLTFVDDAPDAVQGARKVFWDIMERSSRSKGETTSTTGGVQPWMPARLMRFLDDPAKQAVAERLWRDDPAHLDNIKLIAETLQNVNLRNRARPPSASGTAMGVNPLLTPENLQSRWYAYLSGRISGSFLITSIGAVTARRAVSRARQNAVHRLLDNALTDPEQAAMLLKQNNPANRAALGRKAKNWFGNEAATILEIMNEDDDDEDPVVKAATR